MKLICEVVFDKNAIHTLVEDDAKTGIKNHFIEGVFMSHSIKNRNGRIYPSEVLIPEVARYQKDFVTQSRAFGELGHPEGPTINLERSSHMIKELKESGNHITGKAKIIDTPHGKIVKTLIDEGAMLGVSSRGMGSVKTQNESTSIVQNDFRLAAIDIVADPSAPDAFVRGIMEDREWVYTTEGRLVEKGLIHGYKQEISRASSRKLQETQIRLFEDFLRKLSGDISESLK